MSEKTEQSAELRELHNTIDFGFQVEAFLLGDIGKFLVGRAEEEISSAVDKLKVIDPADAKGITMLQNEIYRAESVQYWLAEAIQAGANDQSEFINRGD